MVAVSRKRLEIAATEFDMAWGKLRCTPGGPAEKSRCLEHFARAVQIDPLAGSWVSNQELTADLLRVLFGTKCP